MENNIYISKGNKKLAPNTKVRYLIFNLPAIVTCPFATESCKRACYARKSERCYPSVLPARERNFTAAESETFVADMVEHIQNMLKSPSYAKAKHVIFRIHESGDFYSPEYVKKWERIIDHFKPIKKLHFVAYTKSIEFFRENDYWGDMENATLIYSIWHDTEKDVVSEIMGNGLKYYTAVNSFADDDIPEKAQCHCENCSACFKCFTNNPAYNGLYCEIH